MNSGDRVVWAYVGRAKHEKGRSIVKHGVLLSMMTPPAEGDYRPQRARVKIDGNIRPSLIPVRELRKE